MKQAFAILFALALVLGLPACGGKESAGASAGSGSSGAASMGEALAASEPETILQEEKVASSMPDNGALTVVPAQGLSELNAEGEMRGGTNQNEAVLLPLNTKMNGKTTDPDGLWYAFTTGAAENATYRITEVNKTLDTGNLCLKVYDRYGAELNYYALTADQKGRAATLDLELSPNTTYYILIWAQDHDVIQYSLIIRDPEEQKNGYSTAGSLAEAVGAGAEQTVSPGTNQDDGGMIPLEAQVAGKVQENQYQWYKFTTNGVENATYEVTAANLTPGTGYLNLKVYNTYGEELNYYNLQADQSGEPATLSLDLSPSTTYDLCVWPAEKDVISYTILIHGPAEAAESPEEQLVFETPFELNSTQVMFVANKAEFLDEAAARAALEPVAQVILAHPGHPILLAGTTATDGEQASCVNLSNQRAEAVKGLLVSAFGVPEDQLKTIGLGYAADPFVRGQDIDAKGRFVETEAAKNRRVVVMDANDPIAQQLLNG